jgi:hypothetical protein
MEPDPPWPRVIKGASPMDAAWWRRMRIITGALRMSECEYVEMRPMPKWLARIIMELS